MTQQCVVRVRHDNVCLRLTFKRHLRYCSPQKVNALYDHSAVLQPTNTIWVRSRNCGCFGTWFCYQLIAKPGNKTATVSRPDPYLMIWNLGFTWPWAVWGQRKQAFHCLLLGEAINSIWWPEFRHHLTEGSVRLKFELWCKVSLAPKIAE